MKHLTQTAIMLLTANLALMSPRANADGLIFDGVESNYEPGWEELLGLDSSSIESDKSEFTVNPINLIENPDFTHEGMSCRWVGGVGQGVQCQDNKGYGFSTSCELQPDLCASAQPTAALLTPVDEEPLEAANQEGRNESIAQDEPVGGLLSPLPERRVSLPTNFNRDNDPLKLPLKNEPDPQRTIPVFVAPQRNLDQQPIIAKELQPENSLWANLPENILREANRQLTVAIQTARKGVEKSVKQPRRSAASLGRLMLIRLKLWHAIAHQVSRHKIIRRLPNKYFVTQGIFEKPKAPIRNLWLIADESETIFAPLIRDVSVVEECLGETATRIVRHVEMIAQCAQIPFGERRLFRY